MNRCPITYEECGSERYSLHGLKLLSKNLDHLERFPYTSKEQVQLAIQLAAKLSIQGVQPKLSVILNTSKKTFEPVEIDGRYILKPPHLHFDELPQNEDLSMKLASEVGIEIPLHGMIYNIDDSLSYFIQRFDRLPNDKKIAVEDFSQLLGYDRETKYEGSMEKVAGVIEKHATFPLIEKLKLFRLTIFNFLIGNEDMHLKNFSLIRREDKVELSPAYDLLNTELVLNTKEEIALPIRGKKNNLKAEDFIDYFGLERLKLPEKSIREELTSFENVMSKWKELISVSFLSESKRTKYQELITKRWNLLKQKN